MILKEVGTFLAFIVTLGIISHVLGEAMPRDAIRFEKFPYAPNKWENRGYFYKKLRIEAWKRALPDKSRYMRTMVKKNLGEDRSSKHTKRLIEETCVAELVHWLLLLAGPLFRLISDSVFGLIASILYSLSNVPFIMIQRYNRPRLVAFYRKTLVREALVYENTNPIQQ
ncbi:hypothetical protein SDC9_96925 [bioreactor metagenome]|uniref:Glycosyl-4,4'-diaponeurosporenoate acyltransferase n=1 Tax=bioreactor metagenome TaxID=1076179 RepID=A0A645AAE5_9ZZZZ